MAEIKLPVETGRTLGSRPSNRLRAEGKVPAVVYGHGSDPIPVSVGWRDLRAALTTDASLNALLDLQIDGESKLAIVKDLQRHPIRHTVSHVDFVLINRDEELTVEVPIVLQGEALEVTRENGIADLVAFTLTVKARPADIPNELVVDISELRLGDSIRVADIVLPAGVTTDVDPEESIVVTSVTRAEVETVPEGEEGAEAPSEEAAAESAESGEEATEG
jgi:large subunit ribosomal protein L25